MIDVEKTNHQGNNPKHDTNNFCQMMHRLAPLVHELALLLFVFNAEENRVNWLVKPHLEPSHGIVNTDSHLNKKLSF